jgi:hypothetical protein
MGTIIFEDVMTLPQLPHYTSRDIWDATEFHLCENFSEDSGYQFSPVWNNTIMHQRGCHKYALHTCPLPNQGIAATA